MESTTQAVSGSFLRPAKRKRRLRTMITAYAFLLPTFLFIIGFSYYPAIRALAGAFTQWNGFNPPAWVGLSNFTRLFHDATFISSLGHVLIWTLIGIPLSIIPPFAVAELVFHVRSRRMQYVYRTLLVLSMVIPSLVIILVWQYMYEPTGILNILLKIVGLSSWTHEWIADPRYALWSLIFMQFPWVHPFNLMIFYAGLQAIPSELLDAAAVDGAVSWRRIFYVDVPMVMSQTKMLLILAIVGVSQNLLVPLLMTNGGPGTSTTTPVLYMYQTAVQYDEYGYGMAVAFILFVVVMALAIVNVKYFREEQ